MKQFCMEESEGCSQDRIRFIPVSLDRIGLQLELPEGFYRMEEDRQHRYYPRKGRPDMILENGGGVQITAQSLSQKIEPTQTRSAAEEMCRLTKELFPRYKVSPVYLCGEGNIPAGWFQMEMADMGTEHIKALGAAKEWMVLLTFTYPVRESMKWRSIIRYSFKTLKEGGDLTDGKDQRR